VDKSTFVLLYKATVRPHLEYANSVQCPFKKGDIENVEKVQNRATKLIISLQKLPYLERLRQLKLPILKCRRYQATTTLNFGRCLAIFRTISRSITVTCLTSYLCPSSVARLRETTSGYEAVGDSVFTSPEVP